MSVQGLSRACLPGEVNGSMRQNVKKMATQRYPIDSKKTPYYECGTREGGNVEGIVLVTIWVFSGGGTSSA